MYLRYLVKEKVRVPFSHHQYFAPKFSYPPRVSLDGMRNTVDLIASENPKVAMSLGKDVDETVLDELEKEGYFKKLAGK